MKRKMVGWLWVVALALCPLPELLSASHLVIQCEKAPLNDGNETVKLACSARNWGNDVEYSLASDSKTELFSSGNSLLIWRNPQDDLNVSCTATNPAGSTSKTFSVKKACEAPLETDTAVW
uniref:Uncharacterized protein n=1 Tax=Sphaerodactylus townsendi TaxID=933632 RepID=A0ACB8G892_9SAUR